jgi:3-hydroxy-9,10-secoandrosta-1,3,5(10)-triene-9,17-dione monooxygenase reductase component
LVYPATIPSTPDIAEYRTTIGHFATGVTVVTSWGQGGPSGLTANAVCSLSLDPLLMVVCIDTGSRTLEAIRHSGRLAVNVLARDQEHLAAGFASKAPEGEKFRHVGHEVVDGVPVIDGVVAWLTGRVRELVPGGDHVIGVADVGGVGAPGGDPLVYFRGGFHTLRIDSP